MDRLVLSDAAWARMVPLFTGDPEKLAGPERERLGLHRLPATLEKALAALEGDAVASAFLHSKVLATHVGMKRAEIAAISGLAPAEL